MALVIEDAEVERMARGAARRRGVSMTEALRQLLAEEEARVARVEALMEILRRTAALPRTTDLSEDEILGYDENGIPSPSDNFALTDVKVARLR
jgi:antitoxin VapB